MNSQKIWSAIVAVAIALTGILTGVNWLTIAALGVWVASMLLFGRGRRGASKDD